MRVELAAAISGYRMGRRRPESSRNESRLRISRIRATLILTVFYSFRIHSSVTATGVYSRRRALWVWGEWGRTTLSQRLTTHQLTIATETAATAAAIAATFRIHPSSCSRYWFIYCRRVTTPWRRYLVCVQRLRSGLDCVRRHGHEHSI